MKNIFLLITLYSTLGTSQLCPITIITENIQNSHIDSYNSIGDILGALLLIVFMFKHKNYFKNN